MAQLAALVVTLLLEVPVVVYVAGRLREKPASRGRVVAIAAAASLLSHPFAWMGTIALMDVVAYAVAFVLVEASVVVFEALFFEHVAGWSRRTAWTASVVANVISATAGLVYWYVA